MSRRTALRLALVVALVAWTAAALRRSVWEDELHALHHARSADTAELLRTVRTDNHPPLGFLLQRASVELLGESALALRLPSLLAGAGLVLVVGRLARRLPAGAPAAVAPWLVVASSYVLWIVTEARMYPLLLLASAGLLDALLDVLDPRGPPRHARTRVALWLAVALHAHYHAVHVALVLGATVVLLAARRPELRPRARALLAPALAAAALFLPWALYGLRVQLAAQLPTGGTYRAPLEAAQAWPHFLYVHASLGGPATTYGVALPGAVAAAALGLAGLVRLRREPGGGTLLALLVGAGIGLPVWAWLASLAHPHLSFHWRYLAGAAPAVLLLVAAGAGRGWRAAATAVVLATAAWVSSLQVRGPGDEDLRGAVELVLAEARPGDAFLARPVWPDDPRGVTDWSWYGERLGGDDPGPLEVVPLAELESVAAFRRVWLVHRYRYPEHALRFLRRRYPQEDRLPVGQVLVVHRFAR